MAKTFCVGDIHGSLRSFKQCLERSGFNKEEDTLISLGDIFDGWMESNLLVEELMTIKNLVLVMGNHDKWAMDWMDKGLMPRLWVEQGGKQTLQAYDYTVNQEHRIFLKNKFQPYFLDSEHRLFVHGGVAEGVPLEDSDFLMWDRSLALHALAKNKGIKGYSPILKYVRKTYKEVYLGHTTTYKESPVPVIYGNVILLDQGGGWEGKLSIMDIDTKEFFQSDYVRGLYSQQELDTFGHR